MNKYEATIRVHTEWKVSLWATDEAEATLRLNECDWDASLDMEFLAPAEVVEITEEESG